METAPDWISAISSLVAALTALIAIIIGVNTLAHQKVTADIQLAHGLFSEINRYWDRISDTNTNREYNMGQILVQFEIGAGLFNREVLSESASLILGDHIVEVLTQLARAEGGQVLMERCCSSNTTFVELNKFIAKRELQLADIHEFIGRTASTPMNHGRDDLLSA
jgi:hypothetical protein